MNQILKTVVGSAKLPALVGLLGLFAGCSPQNGVPPTSQLVAEAPGEAASFSAPDQGTVYVAGPSANGKQHLVYTGWVRMGETITVNPTAGRLMIDDKASDVTVHGGNSVYRIWFKPQRHDWLDVITQ